MVVEFAGIDLVAAMVTGDLPDFTGATPYLMRIKKALEGVPVFGPKTGKQALLAMLESQKDGQVTLECLETLFIFQWMLSKAEVDLLNEVTKKWDEIGSEERPSKKAKVAAPASAASAGSSSTAGVQHALNMFKLS